MASSPSARIRIAEPAHFSERALRVLRTVAEVELAACATHEIPALLASVDVFWFRLGHRIEQAMLPPAPRCRIIATPVTGLDHIDVKACEERGIRVLSLRGQSEILERVRATAELTLALLLALLRHLPAAAASTRAGQWNRDAFRGHELFERTAGVVGMGRLGRIVARYLRALGMHVLGHDPRSDFPADAAERVATLAELLERSDVVTLHVAYTPATRHLIGAAELGRMKPGAVLVNTSRGGVVDEAALLRALRAGTLAGAALDVLDGEPDVHPDHPLLAYARDHDRLLILPHLGGNTFESFEKTEVFLAEQVARALGGGA